MSASERYEKYIEIERTAIKWSLIVVPVVYLIGRVSVKRKRSSNEFCGECTVY